MRDRLVFAGLAVVLSLLLYVPVWLSQRSSGSVALYHLGYLVPVVAVMIAALGISWKRKVVFVLASTAGMFAIEVLALATGVSQMVAAGVDPQRQPVAFGIGMVYVGVIASFPFLMLALFVGRRPSRLWERTSA